MKDEEIRRAIDHIENLKIGMTYENLYADECVTIEDLECAIEALKLQRLRWKI